MGTVIPFPARPVPQPEEARTPLAHLDDDTLQLAYQGLLNRRIPRESDERVRIALEAELRRRNIHPMPTYPTSG